MVDHRIKQLMTSEQATIEGGIMSGDRAQMMAAMDDMGGKIYM